MSTKFTSTNQDNSAITKEEVIQTLEKLLRLVHSDELVALQMVSMSKEPSGKYAVDIFVNVPLSVGDTVLGAMTRATSFLINDINHRPPETAIEQTKE